MGFCPFILWKIMEKNRLDYAVYFYGCYDSTAWKE